MLALEYQLADATFAASELVTTMSWQSSQYNTISISTASGSFRQASLHPAAEVS